MATEKQKKYWESKKGKPSWNKGKKLSIIHKENLSISHQGQKGYWLGKKRPENSNEKNNKWKGDDASYYAIHIWVANHFGKSSDYPCKFCEKRGGSKQMHWANIDHKYSRDKKDWIVLCVKCHCNYDKTILGIKRGGDHSSKKFINTNA